MSGWLGWGSAPSSPSSAQPTNPSSTTASPATPTADFIWGALSSVANHVRTFVEQEQSVLAEENQKVASPVASVSRAAAAPWEACSVSPSKTEQLKQRILALCRSKRNFLDPPPADVHFPFDFEAHLPVIVACMKADPNLQKMQFWAVPEQISEKDFWRNYFYRVSMIKEAYGVGEKQLPQSPMSPFSKPSTHNSDSTRPQIPSDPKLDDLEDFVSDANAAQSTEISFDSSLEEEIEAELRGK